MKKKDIKLVKTLKVMWIIALVVWGSVIGINWYTSSFEGEEKMLDNSENYIVQNMMNLNGLDKGALVSMMGAPKEIYKEKMYIYEGSYAEYKIIVNDVVKSVSIDMKKSINVKDIEDVIRTMGLVYSELDGDWRKKEEGRYEYKAYNVKETSSLCINVDNEEIESIDIEY